MTKGQGVIIIILLTLLLAFSISSRFIGGKAQVVKWEYMIASIEDITFDQTINELGSQGWELTFARRAVRGSGYLSEGLYECIFKKPKTF